MADEGPLIYSLTAKNNLLLFFLAEGFYHSVIPIRFFNEPFLSFIGLNVGIDAIEMGLSRIDVGVHVATQHVDPVKFHVHSDLDGGKNAAHPHIEPTCQIFAIAEPWDVFELDAVVVFFLYPRAVE